MKASERAMRICTTSQQKCFPYSVLKQESGARKRSSSFPILEDKISVKSSMLTSL
jgi:hypothetical protein